MTDLLRQHVTCHLPGLALAGYRLRPLGETGLQVPDLDSQSAELVWSGLEDNTRMWRRVALPERIQRLARVARVLGDQGPGSWREVLAQSAGLSHTGLDAAWQVSFATCTEELLWDALRREGLDHDPEELEASGRLPKRIVHILSGNVLPPTFTMLVRGFVLGTAQWIRPSAREPLFATCLASRLEELDPLLACLFAVLWWPHRGSRSERAVLERADVVTVQGDDPTVATLERRVRSLVPGVRFVGYGSRSSLVLLGHEAQVPRVAEQVAWDVALFDQQGCLSPSLVLAEDGPALEAWCAALAQALDDLERRMPRGRPSQTTRAGLRFWRETMRLGRAQNRVRGLWESAGSTAWSVALLEGCRDEPSPLERHIAVAPFSSLDEVLSALTDRKHRLQGIALAENGLSSETVETLVAQLRPTRVAPPGELQLAPPGWPQDHKPPLGSLLL